MQFKKLMGRVGGRAAQILAAVGLVTGIFVVGAPAASAACLSIQHQAETSAVQVQTESVPAPRAVVASDGVASTAGADAAVNGVVHPNVISWTPYDYAAITTYQKCLNRMNWLKGVRPDIKHWDCWEYQTGGCGSSSSYWMVMMGTGY